MDESPAAGSFNTASDDQPTFFHDTTGTGSSLPFQDSAQAIVLFSISHVGMPPLAADPKAPAVRFYGCFHDRIAAAAFAHRIVACDPSCNIQMSDTHAWVLACSNAQRCTDADYSNAKIARMLEHHASKSESARLAFLARSEALRHAGPEPEPFTTTELEPTGGDEPFQSPEAPVAHEGNGPSFLDASCTLAFQAVLCVAFLKDELEPDEPEFAFRVFRACKDELEAGGYIKAVASKHITDHSIDVVDLCSWGFPQCNTATVQTTYRNKQLDDIMRKDAPIPSTW